MSHIAQTIYWLTRIQLEVGPLLLLKAGRGARGLARRLDRRHQVLMARVDSPGHFLQGTWGRREEAWLKAGKTEGSRPWDQRRAKGWPYSTPKPRGRWYYHRHADPKLTLPRKGSPVKEPGGGIWLLWWLFKYLKLDSIHLSSRSISAMIYLNYHLPIYHSFLPNIR